MIFYRLRNIFICVLLTAGLIYNYFCQKYNGVMPILKENRNFSHNCVFLDFQQIFQEIWQWICEWSEVNKKCFWRFNVTRLVVPKLVRFIILLLFTFINILVGLICPTLPPGWHRVNWSAKICPSWAIMATFWQFSKIFGYLPLRQACRWRSQWLLYRRPSDPQMGLCPLSGI